MTQRDMPVRLALDLDEFLRNLTPTGRAEFRRTLPPTLREQLDTATCGICGRITTGAANGDPIYTSTYAIGRLTRRFRTCADCHPGAPTTHATEGRTA